MLPRDLALVRSPGAPTVSPDGRWAVVSVGRPDLDDDGYAAVLWRVDLTGEQPAQQLTHGERDAEPVWSPDGRAIAFLRGGKDQPAQLHLLPADGGDARPLPTHPLGAGRPVWSPDSSRIAYVARVPEPGRYERGDDARPPGKEAPRRITSMRYRLDDLGFLRDRPAHVFVVDPWSDHAQPVQVTSDDLEYANAPAWTRDGTALLLVPAHLDREHLPAPNEVYLAPATGGARLRALTHGELAASAAVHGADGTVYVLGTDRLDEAGRALGLFAVPLDGATPPRRLTDPETGQLVEAGAGPSLLATADGVLALAPRRGSVQLVRLGHGAGDLDPLTPEGHQVKGFDAVAGRLAVTATTATSAGEVGLVADGAWHPLTDFGAPLREAADLLPMQELTTTAPDGYPVHGWLVRPSGEGPHPVLLAIHGGPFMQYGHTLFDEAQVYAGAGYAVVLGNPRGSLGYGEAHGRAIVGDMGNLDRADLMALLDRALEEPGLDADRVGVMGGSYGGFMTAWLAAHEGSRRFRAAIVERALLAFDSFEGSSDIGWLFGEVYVGNDPDKLRAQSPLTHADRIDLPVLIVHSEQDWRCPVEQAQRLFVRLRRRGADAELLLFPGEGHELSRSGLPSHRVARFEAVLDWWGRHLA